jgi:cytochrome b561
MSSEMTVSSAQPPLQPAAAVAVHWLSAALMTLAVAAVLLREAVDAEPWRAALLAFHRQALLTVFALVLLRLVLRVTLGRYDASAHPTPVGRGLRALAWLSHATMYAALVLVPVLGWALTDARGQHVAWLGVLPLPHLAAVDPDRAELLEDWHVWSAWALGALVALHTAAALWHHWVRRDNVLRAMWPRLAQLPWGRVRAPVPPTTT